MDVRFAQHSFDPPVITDGIKPFWRRFFGDFVGLPLAAVITILGWAVLDCWFIAEDGKMTSEIIIHVTLTLTLATIFSIATSYLHKRQQCRMKLIRLPRLPKGRR